MKKLLSIVLICSYGFSLNTFMPFISYIDYSSSAIKNNGYDVGVYYSYYKFPYNLEISAETVQITYKDNTPDYKEKDLTIVGSYFFGNNYKIRAGIRNIFVDENSEYNKVLISGIMYYEYLKYNTGINFYYSDYKNFNVKQLTPYFGFNFGNYYSEWGSFYVGFNLNLIKISNKNNAETKNDNYINSEVFLTNYKDGFSTTLKASFGKNAYKVTNEGFVVYNLGEEYKNSFGIDIGYKINNNNSIKVGFSRSKFEENNKESYSNVYVLTYALSF